jgi:Mg2+/citrate symporter
MICKKCGFEYVDGLKECPNCQAPNEPLEVKVLTKDERDTFGGITIEDTKSENEQGFRVYEAEEEREKTNKSHIHVKTFGLGSSWLWILLFLVILAGLFFFILPLAVIFAIGAVCYYLYSWLFS